MEVKNFLRNISSKRMMLHYLNSKEDSLRAELLPHGISYDGVKVQSSPEDKLAELMSAVLELEQKEGEIRMQVVKDLSCAQELFSLMPTGEYAMLLRLRYVDGIYRYMPWQKISEIMHRDPDHLRKYMHGRALSEAQIVWKVARFYPD